MKYSKTRIDKAGKALCDGVDLQQYWAFLVEYVDSELRSHSSSFSLKDEDAPGKMFSCFARLGRQLYSIDKSRSSSELTRSYHWWKVSKTSKKSFNS